VKEEGWRVDTGQWGWEAILHFVESD